MKLKLVLISILTATLVAVPGSATADDTKVKVEAQDKTADVKDKANDKLEAAKQKAHENFCKGNHGNVTAKTDTSITIDGQRHALTADTRVNKQEEPILLKSVKVGDHICYTTEKAADGSMQVAQLIAIDKDQDKVRVRERENDSPNKVEVETPNKKIEVK